MTNTQAFTKAFSLLEKGIKAKLYKSNGMWYCEKLNVEKENEQV